MRICCSCGDKFLPTGKVYRCPPCRRTYDKGWRASRKAAGRPVISTKMPASYHRAYEAEYFKNEENCEKRNARMRAYSAPGARNRNHHEARWKTKGALASGLIQKKPCEVCGSRKVDAHHADYTKPLDVTWLCRKHHLEIHAKAEGR